MRGGVRRAHDVCMAVLPHSSRPSMALGVSLAALIAGGTVLLVRAVPDSQFHPIAVPGTAVKGAAVARFDAGQDAAGAVGDLRFLTTAGGQPDTDHRPRPTRAHDRTDGAQSLGAGIVRSDTQHKAWLAHSCRATRAESAQPETTPSARGDPRAMLAMLAAAAQRRGPWACSCSCPTGIP
jgi:hypothetical protein